VSIFFRTLGSDPQPKDVLRQNFDSHYGRL